MRKYLLYPTDLLNPIDMLDIPCRIFSIELRIGLAYRSRETIFVVIWLVIIFYAVIDIIAANFVRFPLVFSVYSERSASRPSPVLQSRLCNWCTNTLVKPSSF